MSFDYKAEKPLVNSSLIFTSSNLQPKSRTKDNSSNSKISTPNLQTRAKLTKYGHTLSNIAPSYHQAKVQTKLTIGKPGDKYEQEADKVSDQVINMSQPVQRQQQGEEKMQMKPEIQRQEMEEKEEEGNSVATKPLANAVSPLVQRQDKTEEEVNIKPEIQREQMPEEKEEEAEEGGLQAKSENLTASSEGLEQQLGNSKGSGSPLSDEARSFMEPRFGTDFSDVKVHTDSSAVQMNQDIQAQAFTHGQDIYFNSGKYSP
ncbi:MAG: DUF4157 domain-containing protein, partial [Xenococcaceae cyanobacterium MO_188.B19]|nr:DUF4157 domain-containing protein [Xenococcaceae cyanobacterium MO_188.B19]